jgi:exopolyphosphatase/pppGpp-phosphohydrolase
MSREEFIELVKQETGLNVRVLSGIEEAKCTFFGAVYGLKEITSSLISTTTNSSSTIHSFSSNQYLNVVIDIGGGRSFIHFFIRLFFYLIITHTKHTNTLNTQTH